MTSGKAVAIRHCAFAMRSVGDLCMAVHEATLGAPALLPLQPISSTVGIGPVGWGTVTRLDWRKLMTSAVCLSTTHGLKPWAVADELSMIILLYHVAF